MKVNAIVPMEDGSFVRFDADVSAEEFNYIFTTGLTYLVREGAISSDLLKAPDKVTTNESKLIVEA